MTAYRMFFMVLLLICQIGQAQTVLGIDVSKWQGEIDWNLVFAQGKVFAYVKATEGMTYTDPFFTKNITNGKEAGVIMGAYHFARPDNNTAVQDATNFLSQAKICIGANFLPPALDLENPNSTTDITQLFTSEALTKWAATWCEFVESETGIRPIIYTNSHIANYIQDDLKAYDLWIAKPGSLPNTPPNNLGIWDTWKIKQYSWEGSVLGINGNVDLNSFHGSVEDFKDFINEDFVSVEKESSKNDIRIYPNPTSDVLYLDSGDVQVEKIIVYNMIGKIIYQSSRIEKIDLGYLDSGLYYLEFLYKNGTTSHHVIQKI